jgi:tRNA(Ile2) C34 agmatinyltransferase TiaS
MTEVKRWAELGYEQVPGLANRHISRYLRTQRKNMLRFFQERGFY